MARSKSIVGEARQIETAIELIHLGARLQVPTPSLDALLGLTRLMARTRGLYPG